MSGITEEDFARLEIKPLPGDKFNIVLTSDRVPSSQLLGRSRYAQLATVHGEVRSALAGYLNWGAYNLEQRPQDAAQVLKRICALGRIALGALVGPLRERPAWELYRFFQNVATRIPVGVIPVLTVVSPVDLPFEIMPALWDYVEISGLSTANLFEQCVNRFLGLRFAIHRVEPKEQKRPANLDLRTRTVHGRPVVAVAPYWHEKIHKVRAELGLLGNIPQLLVREPQPNRAATVPSIAELLVRDREDREEIVHITAHCRASEELAVSDHAIVLGVKENWRLRRLLVSIVDLRAAEQLTPQDVPQGPLAFISACGAADLEFTAPTSIPDTFLSVHYRAVISPLVSVHVDPAIAIAGYFYEALGAGRTVAGALRAARLSLLRHHANPLGLAYCCKGESRLRIAP